MTTKQQPPGHPRALVRDQPQFNCLDEQTKAVPLDLASLGSVNNSWVPTSSSSAHSCGQVTLGRLQGKKVQKKGFIGSVYTRPDLSKDAVQNTLCNTYFTSTATATSYAKKRALCGGENYRLISL